MKKIYLFMTMAMMAFATAFTACEDEQVNPNDPIQNDGDENENYQMYSFNETLNYNSTNAGSGSGFSASSRQAVPAKSSDADICALWQNQYGVVLCSPNASWAKEMYTTVNGTSYSNSNSTKIDNLGFVDLQDYYDVNTLENMSVGTSYIGDSKNLGVGVSNLENGQAIAFQTSDGCKGVAKVSLSKVTKTVSISGYVAVPKNSSGSK